MSSRRQKNVERQLIDILNSSANENKCGECGAAFPTWANVEYAVFLCGRCASCHRRALPNKHRVLSLTLDQWSDDQIDRLRRGGNRKNRREWNSKKVHFPYADDDDLGPIEEFLREKYIEGKFRDDGWSSKSGASSVRSRSSTISKSRSDLPLLTHRGITQYEQTQYSRQVRQLMSLGYNDRETNIEALLASNGDVELAIDIIENDRRVNPSQKEVAPALPRRKPGAQATGLTSASQTSVQTTPEWWSVNNTGVNSTATSLNMPPTGQPQIYQYTDPLTGQISYIDQNGQEYLDPNNPQHAQQLQQAVNPQQIQAQQTNQAIMSLYNQPDRFTSVNNQQPLAQNMQQQHQQFGYAPTGFGQLGQQQYYQTGYQG